MPLWLKFRMTLSRTVKTAAGVEPDAGSVCDGSPIEHHPDDIDLVARVRIDGDRCIPLAHRRNRSPAMTFDADPA